ncbi:MAG: hypothetical protein HY820_27945 [Acidobacteria bacterium]|nr:hypothetical protein [Acidobacteriota bacterium]
MNSSKATANRLLAPALAGAALFTFIGACSAGDDQVMVRVPPGGPPIYARVERPFVFHTDQWAAIVFYREPVCVPAGFNLLDLFHFPVPPSDPGAFGCPLTVSGFELRDKGMPNDSAPRHTNLSGLAVPVWFVSWPVLQAAMADNVLTMPELESLAPLKGVAKTFHEVLHPFVPPGVPGGAKVPHLTITASGVLSDGRSFQYEFTGGNQLEHVRIEIR